MPMFQRRHYEAIATTLRRDFGHELVDKDTLTIIVAHIANMLQDDNPRFNNGRFYEAAIPKPDLGPQVSFTLSQLEQAQSLVKGLKRKRA